MSDDQNETYMELHQIEGDGIERLAKYRVESPVNYNPQRVISLVPSMTESLFDLNLGDRLIAVTDYCTRPPERVANLPKIGGTKNPDIDQIIALKPDLVIMNTEENRKKDAEKLQAAGIPIWSTGPKTIIEATNLMWDMMNIFEDASMSQRIRLIEITYETTLRSMTSLPPLRAFVPIWRDPWMTFNRDTFAHDMLHTLGLINIFADRDRQFPLAADLGTAEPLPADDPNLAERDTRYPRVSLEEVIAAQPEIVLLPNEPHEFTQADADEIVRLDIPAAKNGQIHLIDGSLLTWHGTRIAYALRDLPPIIAAARKQINIEK